MKNDHKHHHKNDCRNEKPRGPIRRFFMKIWTPLLSWLAMTGLISTTTVCPFCGQASCPVGIGQAAGLGFISAGILWLFTKFGKKPLRPTENLTDSTHHTH